MTQLAPQDTVRDVPVVPSGRGIRQAAKPITRREIISMVVIGALLLSAIGAGFAVLYRIAWGPEAFAERYIGLLADGRAADALTIPGVAVSSATLKNAKIPASASDALLRRAALDTTLTDIHTISSSMTNGIADVTVGYRTGTITGRTTFHVVQDGWDGVVPRWKFASSPLGLITVAVNGSMKFSVNGFELDKRQVSPAGVKADPTDAVDMLVFTPGRYAVSVDTTAAEAAPVDVLADTPLTSVSSTVQAMPTAALRKIVTEQVHSFLSNCAKQQVLLPTGCPFGLEISDRLVGLPTWSISTQPVITMDPSGAYWAIANTTGAVHIDMTVQSIYDGSTTEISRDVPFQMNGTVTLQPDGSAAIEVGSPNPTAEEIPLD